MPELTMQQCPKCGLTFECKATDIANCQCKSVQLTTEANKLLKKEKYEACLCKECLQLINKLANK